MRLWLKIKKILMTSFYILDGETAILSLKKDVPSLEKTAGLVTTVSIKDVSL